MDNPSRFEGGGVDFHAKYMGCVQVQQSKGQEVCQEAMQRLLASLRNRKEPKQRLVINLSMDGTRLKEMPPGFELLDLLFRHSEVSYVWKDPRDQRSLGIIRSEQDLSDSEKTVYSFHGIRTVKPALPFLQEMQALFQIVKERSAAKKAEAAAQESAAAAAAAKENAASQRPAATATSAPGSEAKDGVEQQQQQQAIAKPPGGSSLLQEKQQLPKNDSRVSLDELGDIFSSTTAVTEPPQQQTQQQFNPFGQQAPFGHSSVPQNPFAANQFGQNQFGQNQFGQNQFGQNQFGQNQFGQNQFGQNQFGQNQFGQSQFGQSQPAQAVASSSNPFAAEGFVSVFDSADAGDILQPESLAPKSRTPEPARPDAFGDLVADFKSSDARKQQVSAKELFKPEKPKVTLLELANQRARP